ncbi:MAG: hypothetical protein AB8G14_00960 [Ilumatobacter sp.]
MQVTGGWNYTGPFGVNLRNFIGGTSLDLVDGQVSGPLVRRVGTPYAVRIGAGSPFTPEFVFRWECTGDITPTQTSTLVTFTPTLDPLEATMDCVVVVDNSNPPTVTVETVVEGDPDGLVEFDTTLNYNFFGVHAIGSFRSSNGVSRTFDAVPGFRIDIASVAAGATPADTQSNTSCFDAGGNFAGGSGLAASLRIDTPGAAFRCVITHTIPPTLTVVEDVVPNDPAAPAADYSKSRFTRFIGPNSWSLLDGESQLLTFGAGGFVEPSLTRSETAGWDLTGVECNELLAGGAVQAYTNFTTSLRTTSTVVSFPFPPPGTDLVCRFVVEPSGPPSVSLNVSPNVFDASGLADFQVSVTGPSGPIDTLTFPATGSSATVLLDPLAGDHTLQLINDQGLELAWGCDAVSSTTTTITFPTILGETVRCTLLAADPFPAGAGSITILKNEEPDNFESYFVSVSQGDFVIGSGTIFDGGPGLLIDNVALGDYVVTETGTNTDYELASVGCLSGITSGITRTAGTFSGDDGNSFRSATFTLDTATGNAPDTDVVCTLVNSPSTTPAIVRIETITDPTGDPQSFSYEIDPPGLLTSGTANFSQVDGDIGSRGVDPGFITIQQIPVAGYTTQSDCVSTGSLFDLTDNLDPGFFVSPGFDYTCRFVNTAVTATSATLDVETVIDPANSEEIDYAVVPAAAVIAPDSATFSQRNGDTTSVTTTAGDPITVGQVAGIGYRTSSECLEGSTVVATGGSSITYTPADGEAILCTFTHVPLPSLTIIEERVPAGLGVDDTQFVLLPVTGIVSGPAAFELGDSERQTVYLEPGVSVAATRTAPAGLVSSVPTCTVPLFDTAVPYTPLSATPSALFVSAALGEQITCEFRSFPDTGPFDLTINAVVDTGAVDLSTGFSFLTDVSGPGVQGATTPGTSRTYTLGNGDSATVEVQSGSQVNLAEIDDLAGVGLFRTSIDCGAAASPVVNVTSTFTMVADTTCTVTFSARTLTVEKQLVAFVIGGFDLFDFNVSPVIDYSGDFSLSDGDQTTLVVPLGESIDLGEVDAGPYGTEIDCTVQTATGPTRPSTGPYEPSDFITITNLTESYFCDVFNFDAGPPVQEVIVNSVIDLGDLAVPDDLAGFFVDLDGEFAFDDQIPEPSGFALSAQFGPGSSSLSLVGPTRSQFVASASALGRSEFLSANGSFSVFVADGSDLLLGAGSGSDRFANSFSCGGVSGTGSVSLTNISSTVRCDLTSSAGVLEVEHIVNGVTTVTDWPFSISQVIAGNASVSLSAGANSMAAVAAGQSLTVALDDLRGADSVSGSCRDVSTPLRAAGGSSTGAFTSALSLANPQRVSVTVPGGDTWRCTFITTYVTVAPPTVPAPTTTTTPTNTTPTSPVSTTVSTPVPAPTTPTTLPVGVPPTNVPTTTVSPTSTPATTTPAAPLAPITPVATVTVGVVTTTTVPAAEPPLDEPADTAPPPSQPPVEAEPPASVPPSDEPAATTVPEPDDPPAVITETEVPEDIYVDIGDPIPVDVDCAGELVIAVNGERQDRVDQIEPSSLGLGDHVIDVSCDGEQITSVRAVVFEQEESSPAGRNMTVIVMFVVMASAGFLFAPSAAGRKRLAA